MEEIATNIIALLVAEFVRAAKASAPIAVAVLLAVRIAKRSPLRRVPYWRNILPYLPWVLGPIISFAVGGVVAPPQIEGWNLPPQFWTAVYGAMAGEMARFAHNQFSRVLAIQPAGDKK